MKLLRWLGPLLTLLLVAAAALASLFGPSVVGQLAGSVPFIGVAAVLALAGFWVGIAGFLRRPARKPVSALIHLGLALGIAGTAADQVWSRSGYVFLESGAGADNGYLRRDLGSVDLLPLPVALDSVGQRASRGFRPAPVAFLSDANGSPRGPVTYNRPLRLGATELVFLRSVEPGFVREYELAVADEHYVLLHNQHVRLPDGSELWSFAVDPEESSVGLALGRTTAWLSPGETLAVGSTRLVLTSLALSTRPGALLAVRAARLRPLLFLGFGLALLGLALSALRRRRV